MLPGLWGLSISVSYTAECRRQIAGFATSIDIARDTDLKGNQYLWPVEIPCVLLGLSPMQNAM